MDKIKSDIPEALLTQCQWFYPIEAPTTQAQDKASVINAERFEECYFLNDSKLKMLILIKETL